ncbi:unnamed protein product [Acanthosepion pharaonis]|uniref:Uncharacterized protein n=1 Tax=Acanthosepion pharaonis TaxID=158019 RepID=A0A812AJW8_ACAPH|nr:unnamed protein product [Sepia pharaonis]
MVFQLLNISLSAFLSDSFISTRSISIFSKTTLRSHQIYPIASVDTKENAFQLRRSSFSKMLNFHWPRASQGFSWTVCILLLSSYNVLSQNSEPSNDTESESGIPAYGSVQLVNGTKYAGRVEVFYDGAWGTICGGDTWGENEAKVVCKSLGFGSGEVLPVTAGSGNIFLAEVDCKGTEESIVDCTHNKFQQNNCTHKSDVGVKCEGSADEINSNSVDNCNFQYEKCGYSIWANSSFTWVRKRGPSPSSSTGPTTDHTYGNTYGYYMYTEASTGYYGAKTRLNSSVSVYSPLTIQFWYHMFGVNIGTLNVITVTNNYEKKVWSKSGNKGNVWKFACIPIKSTFQQLVFEGIRGSSYRGDIAIDDVVLSQHTCKYYETVSCTFQNGLCGYEAVQGNGSSVTWSIISGSSYRAPIYDHTNNTRDGKYAAMLVRYAKEGMKSYLVSQPIKASYKMKIEFFYYMSGTMPGELYVSYKDKSTPLSSWDKNEWHDNGDHGTKWNYGCMNLYPELKQDGNATEKRIVFTGITGTSSGIHLALDDIKLSNGSCEIGIDASVCTFDNPKLCHYKINCTARREYTWRRIRGSTSSYSTGPSRDASKDSRGYYLYAESSFGKAGDAVSIKFPVKNTKGKYLKFNYHMYGQSMGSLHLFYTSGQSSREVWQMSGNQGNVWNFFCRQINEEIDEVKLVAVRGSTYTSDIAVDNVFLTSQPCPNQVDCNFEYGMCNYTVTYSYYRYKWALVSGTDHTYGSGRFLRVYYSSRREGYTTTLKSPVIQQTSNTSSLQFYYKTNILGSSKLIVEINRISALTTVNVIERKSLNMNLEGWVMGCINLPANERVSVSFIAISGDTYSDYIMLDDISYQATSCVDGIVNNICTFEEPNACGYNVSCQETSKFLWKRGQKTSSYSTGPSSDHSGKGRYFMYTESSFGSPGDTTDLVFPEFVAPPGHILSFYYYMYGRDIGTLQVHIITRSGKMLKWSEKGEMGRNWVKGCVNLPVNEKVTVVFTGIRGNGPLGDMAIDDVGVVPGVCYDQGISCDFKDETICGYRNVSRLSNYGWVRKRSGSDYYMNAVGAYEKISLKSPSRNLSDNCIQISYRLGGKYCGLNVYTSYNNHKYLSLKENNNTDWQKAQFYIQNAETSLIFEADIRTYWMYCMLNIGKISILNGTCPNLDCKNASQACTDQGHCVDKSSLCDRKVDCNDGSDESNCSRSISCDFEEKFTCGYNYTYGWSRQNLSIYDLPEITLNNSEYSMVLRYGIWPLMSPFEMIPQSCVQFHHIGDIGSRLWVLVHNSNGLNTTSWNYSYSDLRKWTLGQFEIPGGNISLIFVGFSENLGIALDNVILQNGNCGPIVCPDDSFTCGSNEKCISHRSKCDRIQDCADNSDEVNCTSSIDCDVEDPYQCGYEYDLGTWRVSSGRKEKYPDLDHSRGLYSGKFFVSSFSQQTNDTIHDLHAPEEMLPVDACLTFYYSFHGSGALEILDNGVSMLKIRPNNINTWQKSQIQLSPGKHNITFCHINGNYSNSAPHNVLGLDSIHLSNGTCKLFECKKHWRKCSNSPVCVPEFKFCDHDEDCANGEDERNCTTYSNVRLARGRNVQQGDVEMYYNGRWNLICGSWSRENAAVVCRELGYNESRNTFRTKNWLYEKTYISRISCRGYERSLKSCGKSICYSTCRCSVYGAVDCSNTPCESTHVPCVATNSSNTTSNPQCISKESVCDGEKDCPGGTDEQSCTKCKANEFQCLNYECIPQNKRCDGINNCKDGSDEYHCFKHDNLTLSFMMNGRYTPVCEDNLKEQDIANKLCHYVGKGDASVGWSNTQGTGVKFSFSADAKHSVLPGLKPSLAPCTLLSLNCSRRECGTRSATLYDPVIRYGQKAISGEWPWQVAVMYKGRFSCGGILLNNRYVISAAYCFRSNKLPQYYEIGLGSTVLSSLRKIRVKKLKVHQKYSSFNSRNDIALLELMTPVQMTDYIRPACLPLKPWEPYMICYTTGWGQNETRSQQYELMETKVSILPRESCLHQFPEIDATGMCANNKQPNQPGCYGDEGGPLVCRNMQGYWSVYGIVSRVSCYGHRSSSQLYTDVFTLRKWITDNMMN